MALRNSVLINSEKGIFSVLGLLTIQVEGPFAYFSGEDIDNERTEGAVFYAYEHVKANEDSLSVASILVADVTNDPTEPDVSSLESEDIPALDEFLLEDLQSQFEDEGREIIRWMSSQLNQPDSLKCLITAYVWRDRDKEIQNITARYSLKGRKIAIVGDFDVAKSDVLAEPIVNIIQSIKLLEPSVNPVTSKESPREILAADFKSLYGELPIHGGWGYTKDDACIIDKNDPIVDSTHPFDGVAVEYVFVQIRNYEELIIFRHDGEKYAGIQWKPMKQELLSDNGRYFDKLTIEITGFHDIDWEKLKAEYEGSYGFGVPGFNVEAHEKKRQDKMIQFTREFWFDITSFYVPSQILH